jgi:hypothetical protein
MGVPLPAADLADPAEGAAGRGGVARRLHRLVRVARRPDHHQPPLRPAGAAGERHARVNLVEDGFLAKTRADELPAGPTQHVYVTQGSRDVTVEMTDGLAAIADPGGAHQGGRDAARRR